MVKLLPGAKREAEGILVNLPIRVKQEAEKILVNYQLEQSDRQEGIFVNRLFELEIVGFSPMESFL